MYGSSKSDLLSACNETRPWIDLPNNIAEIILDIPDLIHLKHHLLPRYVIYVSL